MAAPSIVAALGRVGGPDRARVLFPGVLACGVVAAASTFLSQHYGAPVMLFALLLGMAMNFLSADGPCAPGIAFAGRTLLRVGRAAAQGQGADAVAPARRDAERRLRPRTGRHIPFALLRAKRLQTFSKQCHRRLRHRRSRIGCPPAWNEI